MRVVVLNPTHKPQLPPRLITHNRNRIGKIQAATVGLHRDTQTVFEGKRAQYVGGQTSCFRAEQQHVTGLVLQLVVRTAAFGGAGQNAPTGHGLAEVLVVFVDGDFGEIAVIQPGAAQFFLFQIKTERLDQMQPAAIIGDQAKDIAGIGRNLRFKKGDMKHGGRADKKMCRILTAAVRYVLMAAPFPLYG
jgi:hypothetical protein